MPSTTKQQQYKQKQQQKVGRIAADKAERPQSTLSASEGSDSGCSFGGISPVNFGWPIGENSTFQQQSGYASPSSRIAVRKHNGQEFEKTRYFHENETEVELSQTESLRYLLSPYQNGETFVGSSKALAATGTTNAMFSSSTLSSPLPPPPPPNSVSMQSLHSEIAAISDITQYINPDIHNVRLNALQNGRGAGLAGATPKPSQQDMYKTVMCQAWLESTKCLFGENCKFAHGEAELRPARITNRNNAKYKTKLCEKYTTNGICPYGDRCLFIHPMSTSSISSSSSSAAENRKFVNPSFVNPDIHQRAANNSRHSAGIASGELVEVDNSEVQQKLTLHLAEASTRRNVESTMMFGGSDNVSHKKSSSPFLTNQSSFFTSITKNTTALQPPPSLHQKSLAASVSRNYSTGSIDTGFGYNVGNSDQSIWSKQTADSSYGRGTENDKLQLQQQQMWCTKLKSWQESAHLPDELRSRKRSSNCGQIMQQHQQTFFETQRRARCCTQNEQNSQTFTPLSSSSGSMLCRLNNTTPMDNATRMAFLRFHTPQQRHIVGDFAEAMLADNASPLKSYFNGSAALGHAESAIWSSDSSRFVMGGDHASSHTSTHSAASFFGSDYDEFLLEEEKPSVSVILNDLHDDSEVSFGEVYNTINSLYNMSQRIIMR